MDTLFKILLTLHIIGESLALLTGYGAMWVKRGGPIHRQLGRWYVRGMSVILLTGLPMSILHPNVFLFGIFVFTGYFVISGYRSAVVRTDLPKKLDWSLATGLSAVSLAALVGLAFVWMFEMPFPTEFLITGAIFSALGFARGMADLYEFWQGPIAGKIRIRQHLIGMCAGLIATTTAVAVTMIGYLPAVPPLVAWIGPTLIVSPLIARWSRQVMDGKYQY